MYLNGVVFTLTAAFSDGTTANANATITAFPSLPTAPTIALNFDGLMRDRVGQAEFALGADGKLDGTFSVTLNAGSGNRTVTRLSLTNTPGGIWDTQTPNTYWSLGIAKVLDTALLNASDDAVNFTVSNGTSFKIFAADYDDAMYLTGVVFTLQVDFADGSSAIASITISETLGLSAATNTPRGIRQ